VTLLLIPDLAHRATQGAYRDLPSNRPLHLAVTTTRRPTALERAAALEAAARHALPFAPREEASLAAVARAARADALLVLSERRAAIWLEGELTPWQPGMGELRLRRLLAGEAGGRPTRDGFLEAAELRPGDALLDATLGLGADAVVAAGAVGPTGRVLGIEISPALAALAAEGLRRHGDAAVARIEVVAGDALEVLRKLPDRSFDVVAFDPMFRHGRDGTPSFDLVRRLADPRSLSPGALAQARRVARRAVVVKDGVPGWDLARLGLAPIACARWAERLYARIDVR
jgi:16S rRNA (guanine1516-N2)-methyltransferase